MTFRLTADGHGYRLPLVQTGLGRRSMQAWFAAAIECGYTVVTVQREEQRCNRCQRAVRQQDVRAWSRAGHAWCGECASEVV